MSATAGHPLPSDIRAAPPVLTNKAAREKGYYSYLEEEVAVDEPGGVAEADELHHLGQLQVEATQVKH